MSASAPRTVSEGTLRPEDLIPRFADELEGLGVAAQLKHQHLLDEARAWAEGPVAYDAFCDGGIWREQYDEFAGYILGDLFDALGANAPEGLTFGAHPGDGACFGFWLVDEEDAA